MVTSDFIKRLDIKYDIYAIKRDWVNLKEHVSPKGPLWRQQISLTHKKNFKDGDIWHQIGGSKGYGNATEDVINQELKTIAPYLWYICNDMKSRLDVGRIRIIVSDPHSAFNIHQDWEVRWHIVINSPRDSFTYFVLNENYILDENILDAAHGIGFHMPSDGYVYEMNAITLHSGVNCGHDGDPNSNKNEQKVHILFNALYK